MEDKNRSNEQMLEEILQEAHTLRESHKTAETAATEPPSQSPEAMGQTGKGKKQRKWPFGRRDRHYAVEEPDETEDIYYGLQLKPIEEYQKDLEDTGEQPLTPNHPTEEYSFLFDNSPEGELDEEIASRFRELHNDRRRRVKEALESEGLDFHQVVSEFGVIQPLPKKTGIDHGKEIFSVSPGAKTQSPEISSTPTQPPEEPAGSAADSDIETAAPEVPASRPSLGVLKPDDDEFTVDAILAQVREKNLRTVRAQTSPVDSRQEPAVIEEELLLPTKKEPSQPEPEAMAPTAEESAKPQPKPEAAAPAVEEPAKPQPEPKATAPAVEEPAKPQPEPETAAPAVEEPAKPQPNPEAAAPAVEKPEKPQPEPKAAAPAVEEPAKPQPEPKAAASAEKKPAAKVSSSEKKEDSTPKEEPSPSEPNPFVDETPRQPKMPREAREGPCYAPHTKPVHLMDMDVLDFALREEAKFYEEQIQKEKEEEARRRKKKYMKMKQQKALEKGFSLNGEEPQEDSPEEPQEPEEELEDFNSPSDAPSVSHDLWAGMRELILRVLVTGLCTGLLGLFGLMGEFNNLFSWDISREITTAAYMALNVIFLLLSMGFCFRMIGSGLMALVKFRANSDSALSLASIAALIQAVYACFFPEEVMSGSLHLYSVLASGALFLNSVGKLVMIRRIWNNFRFVSSRESKYAVQLYDDYNTSLKLARDCVMDSPVIAYQQKAGFLSRFLQYSYEPDPLENNSQILAPIGFIASLALCGATLMISHSASQAISAFAAASCICVPFTGLLGGNLLLKKLSALAKKCGAMAVGYPAVEKFSSVNAVMLDAQDLYPKGTVVLGGIKTFGNQRIDEAILEATSLMCAAGGPLVSIFDQIIQSRREILPKVDKPVYEDERGLTGWVSGHRVLIGNRDLLAAHHIDPPSREFENKYTAGGKKAAYLAVGGQLVAMFLLTYRSDSHRARELQRLEANGVSLIVHTCDPNITSSFLANAFGLDPHSIRVLPDSLGQEYVRVTQGECPRTPALLATRGRAVSMLRIISACIRTRSNLTLAAVMQSVSVILGFVLVAFMACYSGLQQLTTLSLLLYEVFWSFVILFFPRLHKP